MTLVPCMCLESANLHTEYPHPAVLIHGIMPEPGIYAVMLRSIVLSMPTACARVAEHLACSRHVPKLPVIMPQLDMLNFGDQTSKSHQGLHVSIV